MRRLFEGGIYFSAASISENMVMYVIILPIIVQ